ncbi:MAG: nickel insertion protein [Gammaproteobacteria bacterium]
MSEALRLLMAQVDDVPGELMGEFITRAEALGARNVQVVPSLTKKNRPAYLVYLDVPAALEAAAGRLLGAELGCWGYRVLAAEHRHFDITRQTLALTVQRGDVAQRATLRVKTIADGAARLRVKAEHDDLAAMCGALRAAGVELPLAVLKAAVESHLATASPLPDALDLHL